MPLAATIFTRGFARAVEAPLWLLPLLCFVAAGCYRNECSPSGTSRCEQNQVVRCEEHPNGEFSGQHTEWTSSSCSPKTCVELTGLSAACVESVEKDPLCGNEPTAQVCSNGDYAQCSYGYRLLTQSCPANVDWGIADASRCVDPVPFHAVCVPQDAQIDPICGGGSGPKCDGTTLVQCLEGYGMRTACRTCATYPQGYYPRWQCAGMAGYGCLEDADCADGLVCAAQPPSQGYPSPSVCAAPAK